MDMRNTGRDGWTRGMQWLVGLEIRQVMLYMTTNSVIMWGIRSACDEMGRYLHSACDILRRM